MDNEPQPDAVLLRHGGQTRLSDDGYIEGAPEFVAEMAASTATIDLRDKKRVYRRNQVKEYLVWQVMDRRIDWFSLQEEEYISLLPDAAGIIRICPTVSHLSKSCLNIPQSLSLRRQTSFV